MQKSSGGSKQEGVGGATPSVLGASGSVGKPDKVIETTRSVGKFVDNGWQIGQ